MKSKLGMGGSLSAKVIRANGKVEDLGDLAKRDRINLYVGILVWAVILGGIMWILKSLFMQ